MNHVACDAPQYTKDSNDVEKETRASPGQVESARIELRYIFTGKPCNQKYLLKPLVVCDEFPQVAFGQTNDIRVLVLFRPSVGSQNIQSVIAFDREVSSNWHLKCIQRHTACAKAGKKLYQQYRVETALNV